MTPNYGELGLALAPELDLVVGALLILGFDLITGKMRSPAQRTAFAVVVGLIALSAAVLCSLRAGTPGNVFGNVLRLDTLTFATRVGVLGLAALTLVMMPGVARLRHPAEYVAIVLFATAGFTLMAAAQQLLVAFLAIELASLSLYVLAGFDKTRAESAEAALKYFLLGGVSAAFLLFGFSLIYGLTGSIELPEIAQKLGAEPPSLLLTVALVMILVAFGFKAAAAPFHLWAPDVYQGAPVSSAALIASASKLAGFTLFVRLLWAGLQGEAAGAASAHTPAWMTAVVAISAISILVGNLAALAQTNLRRLLAYSAIAHAGALLIGVIVAGREGPGPLFYYAATYGLATVGAFGVIGVVERAGRCQSIDDLAGLHRRSPLLAACLLVCILSLAGIPPLAGFFGKFVVFAAAFKLQCLDGSAAWLALLALGMSTVALYYYLLVLKQAVVVRSAIIAEKIAVPLPAAIGLCTVAALLLLLGLFPSTVLQLFGATR